MNGADSTTIIRDRLGTLLAAVIRDVHAQSHDQDRQLHRDHAPKAQLKLRVSCGPHQAGLKGYDDELGAIMGTEFHHGPVHVGLDGQR